MAKPLRMCVVCRKMQPKEELLRVSRYDGQFKVDTEGKLPGRGAYICRSGDCITKIEKQRSFERAFKGALPQRLIENIKKELIQ